MKPRKYNHNMGIWKPETYCTFPKCLEKVVMCKHGFRGHYVYWILSDEYINREDGRWYKANKRIAHAHFLRNVDVGRHIDDSVCNTWIHESDCVLRVKIKKLPYYKFPDWVMEDSN